MRLIAYCASLALLLCACAVKVQAQSKEEVVTDIVMQAAEAWDRAREARLARAEEQARQAQARMEDEARLKEEQLKDDEQRRQKEAAALRNWPGLAGLTPPLEAGEVLGETENGCGIVMAMNGSKTITVPKYGDDGKYVTDASGKAVLVQMSPQAYLRTVVWSGDCPNGLAHGLGTLVRRDQLAALIDLKFEYFYGRSLSRSLRPGRSTGARVLGYSLAGQVHATIPAWRDPFVPRFGKWGDDITSTQLSLIRTAQGVQSTFDSAELLPCTVLEEKPRGCSSEKNFTVPAISVMTFKDKAHQTTRTQCPDLRDGKNCAALWQQIAGPLIAEMQPLIAQAEADDQARRKRYADLNAMYVLNARIMQMAHEAQGQKDIERRKAAAAEGAAAEKKKREAAEAESLAKQQQADREFKAKLSKLNAGQLYVMADELKAAGKTAQAREALHALITRFPDHALAANAATMLATLK